MGQASRVPGLMHPSCGYVLVGYKRLPIGLRSLAGYICALCGSLMKSPPLTRSVAAWSGAAAAKTLGCPAVPLVRPDAACRPGGRWVGHPDGVSDSPLVLSPGLNRLIPHGSGEAAFGLNVLDRLVSELATVASAPRSDRLWGPGVLGARCGWTTRSSSTS